MSSPDSFSAPEKQAAGRVAKYILWAVFIALGAAAILAWQLYNYAYSVGPVSKESSRIVYIPRGTSVAEIGGLLAEAGLLHDDRRFVILTKIMGAAGRLQAGEFRLQANQAPVSLIQELLHAKPLQHSVTIPEGKTIPEVAEIFARGGWASAERFIGLANDPAIINEIGLNKLSSLEGYLYPDTYYLTRPGPDEKALLQRLVGRSLDVWNELAAESKITALDRHELYTLASIVEKETASPAERPLIASVFLNRLKRGMRLQSDPTVVYGVTDFSGSITRAHLERYSPYNTYLIKGLPPGPICSPGKEALKAVLSPSSSDYLYFVSKNDGTHQFSKTLREHNRAVRKYQR